MQKNNRVQCFVGPDADRRAEIAGNWLKAICGNAKEQDWCISHNVPLTRAQAEGTNSSGGFLVPTELDDAIIIAREQFGAFRQGTQVRPITAMSMVRPRRINGLTASYVSEGQSIPESSFELDALDCSPRKLAILARASSELFEDEAAGLAEFIANECAYAMSVQEDQAAFNGDGSPTYGGVVGFATKLAGSASAVDASAATFAALTGADLGSLIGAVIGTALPGAAWYCNPVMFGQVFCRLAAAGGAPLLVRSDGTPVFAGFPVRLTGALPDSSSSMAAVPMCYFGDLSMASVLAERRALVIATSRQRALEKDQILVRATERQDIICHLGVSDPLTQRTPVAMLVGKV